MAVEILKLHHIEKKHLTRSKGFLENVSFEMLCDGMLPSLTGQSEISCFIIPILNLDDYKWQPNFST